MKSIIATLTFTLLTFICFSQDSIPANYTGIQTTYYNNGNIKSEGKFVNGKREGVFIYYNENGLNKTKRTFANDRQQGDCLYYLQEPVKADLIEKQINGKSEGEFIHYYKNGEMMETGKFVNGLKDGEWIYYNVNGEIRRKESYKEGQQSGPTYDYLNSPKKKKKKKKEDTEIQTGEWIKIFQIGEKDSIPQFAIPMFPGGFPALIQFINSNIKFPQTEKESGFQGTVSALFVVGTDGSVSNICIDKGNIAGPGFEQEALRIIRLMPKWTPGKENGNTIKVAITMPFGFKLH
jgi:TonB family protein